MQGSASKIFDKLIQELGNTCGYALGIVDGSAIIEGDYISCTAISSEGELSSHLIRSRLLAKLFVAPGSPGNQEIWALLFYYVNGARVAPLGATYLRVRVESKPGGVKDWVAVRWELDEFDEWSELEHLEDLLHTRT